MKVYKRISVLLLLSVTLFSCQQKAEKKEVKKPNILFLLADDLGYGELGCYGQKVIKTPVLDNMAAEGIRFTNFYAGNPVCSPSRAVLMTGIHSGNNAIRGNKGEFDRGFDRVALRKTDVTLAEMLKGAGYQTGFVGKWHMEDPNDLSTWAYNRGFDYAAQEQWSSPFGGAKYTVDWEYINGLQDSVFYNMDDFNCKDEFRTNLAFDYLDKINKDEPFFLFMSYRAPHAHEYDLGNKTLYADKGWPDVERRHAAKITLLDKQIGRMLKKLEEMGELDNTLILFTSDNGPTGEGGHDYEFFNSNGDLQGYKRDTYEGGIRVPTMAWWKGKIKAGTVSDFIGSGQDFMATLAEVVGVEKPKQANGISILPVLTGGEEPKREFLNWEFFKPSHAADGFRQAVRIDNMKAVRYGVDNPIELYDLDKDISEANNVASQYPELIKRVDKIFKEERTANEHFPYGGYKK
ncbi:arylsulfatase [Labilibacter marinus]|uniref:arylsulfatase n=1 Tax=Labilibacter marinus TaxID=1477105 RepID=UPI00082C34BE|nr:arylsulfatase [Labilibacter marinus]